MNTSLKTVLIYDNAANEKTGQHTYPTADQLSAQQRLFMVCAGMGDDVHAAQVTDILYQNFAESIAKSEKLLTARLGQIQVNDTLRHAERKIQTYINQFPRLKGVGGVLALAHINNDGSITLAWVGNCRIYHIRNGKIIYQTEDHIINLMQDGDITTQPRAVNGNEPAWASVSTITNIQPNDILLIATPAIITQLGEIAIDQLIVQHLNAENLYRGVLAKLQTTAPNPAQAQGLFTLQIEDSVLANTRPNLQQGNQSLSSYADILSAEQNAQGMGIKRNLILQIGIVLTALLILAGGSYLLYRYFQNQPERTFNRHLTEAQALAAEGNYEAAINNLENALKIQEVEDPELRSTASYMLQQMQQSVLLLQADSLLNAGAYMQAKANYEKAYNIDTDNTEVRTKVTEVTKMFDLAKRTRLVKADSLLAVKDYTNARNQFYEALLYDQTNKRILEKINLCNVKLKKDTISLSQAVERAGAYLQSLQDTLK